MFTSVTENKKPTLKRTAAYIAVSVFCVIFSTVYSLFSHGVHSVFMTFLFAFPLALGALPNFVFLLTKLRPPNRIADNLWNSGIAAVTVSSALRGVFEIAGTGSAYQELLMYAGGGLLFLGIVFYAANK